MDTSGGSLAERRHFRRYPSWIDARLHLASSRVTVPVIVLDISQGGALVSVSHQIDAGESLVIRLEVDGITAVLPSIPVSVEDSFPGMLVHLQFARLTPARKISLFQLIDRLEPTYEEYQAFLAGHPVGAAPRNRYPHLPASPGRHAS